MANDVNHVILIGRLTRDAELKFVNSGNAVGSFSIAVNRNVKNGDNWEEKANFFDIELWGKQAETLNQFLVKGKQVAVEGNLAQDRWEKDGQPHSKVKIVANNVELLGGGTGASGGAPVQGGGPRPGGAQAVPAF